MLALENFKREKVFRRRHYALQRSFVSELEQSIICLGSYFKCFKKRASNKDTLKT